MAIATYADWEDRLFNPRQFLSGSKINLPTTSLGRSYSLFVNNPLPGVAPTTAAVPASTIAGAIGQENGGANALRIPGIRAGSSHPVTMILCDRLSHQGGLSGIVTTAQTTNLPTAALTRYTSGVGVMCGLEIYTQIGATGTTVTISYTDDAGNTGQISPAVVFGGTGFREATRLIQIPNVAGDKGFRAVASVTVLATTGTAGNFGVTLFKPLLYLSIGAGEAFTADPISQGSLGGGLEEILDDACLFWLAFPAGVPIAGQGFAYTIPFAED